MDSLSETSESVDRTAFNALISEWDTSSLKECDVERLFGKDSIDYINSPNTKCTRYLDGESAVDVMKNIMYQLGPARLQTTSDNFHECVNHIPDNIGSTINSMSSAIERIQSQFNFSGADPEKKSLMQFLWNMRFEDSNSHMAKSMCHCLNSILDAEISAYTEKNHYHKLWLDFYRTVISAVTSDREVLPPQIEENEVELPSYVLLDRETATFRFKMVEKEVISYGGDLKDVPRIIRSHPDSLLAVQDEKYMMPFMILEIRSSRNKTDVGEGLEDHTELEDEEVFLAHESLPDIAVQSSTFSTSSKNKRKLSTSEELGSKRFCMPGTEEHADITSGLVGSHSTISHQSFDGFQSCHEENGKLRIQHFCRLIGPMKDGTRRRYKRPAKMFGIIAIRNKVYLTCLSIPNEDRSFVLNLMLSNTSSVCSRQIAPDIRYQMVCTDALNILNPVHLRAFLWYINILLKEQTYMKYFCN